MYKFMASSYPAIVLQSNSCQEIAYPFFRNINGDKDMYCVSPLHGRSYVVGKLSNGRYVVSKGNGVSYTCYQMLNTGEFGDDTLGLLLRKDAERDFQLGIEVESLGIKTNHMEYIIELQNEIQLTTGHVLKPVLLQYDLECPYRICDAAFMTGKQINGEVTKWEKVNERGYNKKHMIAANVLIHNLRILHDNQILHNAIHEQNYTWALELLDFELACSPSHPYDSEDDIRHVKDLFPREIMQTYIIINYIAGVLKEETIFEEIDNLFYEYGFDVGKYSISIKA